MTSGTPEVVVVDFGMGNLRSVARALERAGAKPVVCEDPESVLRADRVVVPGVGSCGDAMRVLRERGLAEAIGERVRAGRPYLGICLGLHVLLERAEEGDASCLGLIAGEVTRFPDDLDLPVPHMGWNRVVPRAPHPVLCEGYFYFVHGYRASRVPDSDTLAETEYGGPFPSAIGRGACVAVQFHPEKSQRAGLELLERFSSWAP